MAKQGYFFYQFYSRFQKDLESGRIQKNDICYIKSINATYTHGTFFYGISAVENDRIPTSDDKGYPVGTVWIVKGKTQVFILIRLYPDMATWVDITRLSDYTQLANRPGINGVVLTGNMTLDALGIQPKGDYATKKELIAATPSIGDNGNWYIGGIDSNHPSRGADGVSLGDVALVQNISTDAGSENKVISQKGVTLALRRAVYDSVADLYHKDENEFKKEVLSNLFVVEVTGTIN